MHPNILQAAIEEVCHADRGEGSEVGRHRIFSYTANWGRPGPRQTSAAGAGPSAGAFRAGISGVREFLILAVGHWAAVGQAWRCDIDRLAVAQDRCRHDDAERAIRLLLDP